MNNDKLIFISSLFAAVSDLYDDFVQYSKSLDKSYEFWTDKECGGLEYRGNVLAMEASYSYCSMHVPINTVRKVKRTPANAQYKMSVTFYLEDDLLNSKRRVVSIAVNSNITYKQVFNRVIKAVDKIEDFIAVESVRGIDLNDLLK
ncbi:hypothetical protein [Algivirga pacifica]|uniref:Uncharacterized protein n=1 Tax=Algivirga pacifica TaxID=1162670 RepID=A0ABP9D1T3_9BACT